MQWITPALTVAALLGSVDAQLCAVPEAIGAIPATGMYEANRQSGMQRLLSRIGGDEAALGRSIVYLQGAAMEQTFFADTEKLFRQESNFLYMCQYEFPFSANVVSAECIITAQPRGDGTLDVESWLFVAKPGLNYAVWDGAPYTLEQLAETYEVDNVLWREDMDDALAALRAAGKTDVYGLPNVDLSKSAASSLATFNLNDASNRLLSALGDARTLKNPAEVELITLASKVSSFAHRHVMRNGHGNEYDYDWEYQIASDFKTQTGMCSQERQAYLAIVGGNKRSSILHYNRNLERVDKEQNDIVLIDAGSEGNGYGTDITRTWPTNGKFTEEQKVIYEVVLYSQDVALHGLTLGASWTDVSRNSTIALVDGLRDAGLVQGDLQGAINARVDRTFMPHGLGHNIGIDVHDPGFRSPLTEGMVFTVEPGIYMIDALLERDLESPTVSPYLNKDMIDRFTGPLTSLGGVRIEDMIVMTQTGWDNMSGDAPRTVEDIERFIATGEFTYDPVKEKRDAEAAYERMLASTGGKVFWPQSRMDEKVWHH